MSPADDRSATRRLEPEPERLGRSVWAWLGLGVVCTALGLFVGARDFHVRPAAADLADAFPAAAARAAAAAHAERPGAGLAARLESALALIAVVRRTDRLTGTDPDAVLARAQRAAEAGDLYLATCDIAALPPAGRKAMSTWREGAERRLAQSPAPRIPTVGATP